MLVVVDSVTRGIAEVYGAAMDGTRQFERYEIPLSVLVKAGISPRKGQTLLLSEKPNGRSYNGGVLHVQAPNDTQRSQADDISRFLDWD